MDANYDTCNNLVVQEFISEAQTCVKCPGLMNGSSLLQKGDINRLDSIAVAIEQVGVCSSGTVTTEDSFFDLDERY